jgi:hypothetical protein
LNDLPVADADVRKITLTDGEGHPSRTFFILPAAPEHLILSNRREDLLTMRAVLSSSLQRELSGSPSNIPAGAFGGYRENASQADPGGSLILTVDSAAQTVTLTYTGRSRTPPTEWLVPNNRLSLDFHSVRAGVWAATVSLPGDDGQAVETIAYLMSIFGFTVNM